MSVGLHQVEPQSHRQQEKTSYNNVLNHFPKVKMSTDVECIKVCARCRPLSKKEIKEGSTKYVSSQIVYRITNISTKDATVSLSTGGRLFTFDYALDASISQQELFFTTSESIVQNVLQGFNGTILAYGQTGSGKTFTMEGEETDELKGIIQRSIESMFQEIQQAPESTEYLLRISFIEIYRDKIIDLFGEKGSNENLHLKESPEGLVYVQGLKEIEVKTVEEVLNAFKKGKQQRHVSSTAMNAVSSRSHSIFSIVIEISEETEIHGEKKQSIRIGKLNLVDLAGSEKQKNTKTEGLRLAEATRINLSLSALSTVIYKLTRNDKTLHIPYRDSKLTRLLQNSIGGNSKTLLIATLSPASANAEESLNTLRFANRAKMIQNKPTINENPQDALLRQYQTEISNLKKLLENGNTSDRIFSKDFQTKFDVHKSQSKSLINETRELKVKTNQYQSLLREKDETLRAQKDEKIKAQQKLEQMQKKLLHGSAEKDTLRKREHQLRVKKMLLKEKKKKEKQIRKAVEKEHAFSMDVLQKRFASSHQKVDAYREKLDLLTTALTSIDEEIEDMESGYQQETNEMLELINELQSEISLNTKISKLFVNEAYQKFLQRRMKWVPSQSEYQIISELWNGKTRIKSFGDFTEHMSAKLETKEPFISCYGLFGILLPPRDGFYTKSFQEFKILKKQVQKAAQQIHPHLVEIMKPEKIPSFTKTSSKQLELEYYYDLMAQPDIVINKNRIALSAGITLSLTTIVSPQDVQINLWLKQDNVLQYLSLDEKKPNSNA